VILVDTSIWIDHLRRSEPDLVTRLERDEIGSHRFVIEELALGSIARRDIVLRMLAQLRAFPTLQHRELLTFVEDAHLWGRGLSTADVHLLGSVALVPGARLWTRDKRLIRAAGDLGAPIVTE
jgi:predicted nucleic acid-binding protein